QLPLRVGSVAVRSRRAVEHHQHEEPDPTYDRDQPDEPPESRPVRVVDPAYRNGDARDDENESVGAGDGVEKPSVRTPSDDLQDAADDRVDQGEHPELSAAGAPVKHGALPHDLDVPTHCFRAPRLSLVQAATPPGRRMAAGGMAGGHFGNDETGPRPGRGLASQDRNELRREDGPTSASAVRMEASGRLAAPILDGKAALATI